MMKTTVLVICVLLFTVAAGNAQQKPEPAGQNLDMPVVDQAGKIVFPGKVERPPDLRWISATNGLALASWSMADWPFVFCAVRNPTKTAVKYPGGCGLGWWEFTTVRTRQTGMTNWTTLKIRPAPANTRVVTGIDPIQTDLAPGLEMRPPNSIFDRSFSFHIDLAEYIFPAELTGSVEIQILSLEYEFPVIAMSMKTIRESSKATDGDNRM